MYVTDNKFTELAYICTINIPSLADSLKHLRNSKFVFEYLEKRPGRNVEEFGRMETNENRAWEEQAIRDLKNMNTIEWRGKLKKRKDWRKIVV